MLRNNPERLESSLRRALEATTRQPDGLDVNTDVAPTVRRSRLVAHIRDRFDETLPDRTDSRAGVTARARMQDLFGPDWWTRNWDSAQSDREGSAWALQLPTRTTRARLVRL